MVWTHREKKARLTWAGMSRLDSGSDSSEMEGTFCRGLCCCSPCCCCSGSGLISSLKLTVLLVLLALLPPSKLLLLAPELPLSEELFMASLALPPAVEDGGEDC